MVMTEKCQSRKKRGTDQDRKGIDGERSVRWEQRGWPRWRTTGKEMADNHACTDTHSGWLALCWVQFVIEVYWAANVRHCQLCRTLRDWPNHPAKYPVSVLSLKRSVDTLVLLQIYSFITLNILCSHIDVTPQVLGNHSDIYISKWFPATLKVTVCKIFSINFSCANWLMHCEYSLVWMNAYAYIH